jgi:hypothetical protein
MSQSASCVETDNACTFRSISDVAARDRKALAMGQFLQNNRALTTFRPVFVLSNACRVCKNRHDPDEGRVDSLRRRLASVMPSNLIISFMQTMLSVRLPRS